MKRLSIAVVILLACGGLAFGQMGKGPSGAALPSMSGQTGKYLTNDGSKASWGSPSGSGDMMQSEFVSGGKIKTATGGTGQDSSAWTGCFPYLLAGTWTCDGNSTKELRLMGAQAALSNPVTGTGTNHYWAYWTGTNAIAGKSITASKPVCSDSNGDPAVCAGTEGVWLAAGGTATAATALAANGSNCSSGYAALGVDASGAAEGCWNVTPAAIGAIATGGNAGTATALAANGANCNSGYAPLGVDASGAVEGCWQVTPAAISAVATADRSDNDTTSVGDTTHVFTTRAAIAKTKAIAPGKSATYPLVNCMTFGATSSFDIPALWRFPYAVTIVGWHCLEAGATNVVGGFDECDGNGANCNAMSSDATCTTTNTNVTSLNGYAAIDAGHYIGWHTTSVSGVNSWATICIDYTVD